VLPGLGTGEPQCELGQGLDWGLRPSFSPLFTEVRGRGILRTSRWLVFSEVSFRARWK
jgi:hypothetical protein